ncbi:MAG: PAP2 family protein [Verrucomicrobia bacterium]|nr:PAP2 family protein [Verrucomicrobiota bacterium]
MIKGHVIRNLLLVLVFSVAGRSAVCGSDQIRTAGNVFEYALPSVAVGVILYHEDGEGALQFGKGGLLTVALTQGLKFSVDERRPNGEKYSFPSGHTSWAFFNAEFVRERYGWEWGIPAYVAASFVGYSRVEAKIHYTHDVLAGAAIGIGSSWLFTTPYKGWQVEAELSDSYFGLGLCRQW